MSVYDRLVSWSSWWWPWFGNHLWQSTLAALLLLGVTCLLRRAPARFRYALLWLAAAKFLLPSSLFVYLAHKAGAHWEALFADPTTPSGSVSILYHISAPSTAHSADPDPPPPTPLRAT